jgi:hypothetical protein
MGFPLTSNPAPGAPAVPLPRLAVSPIATFEFLCLPPEVRNMVYELLAMNYISIRITTPRPKYHYDGDWIRRPMKYTFFACLSRVNKQINAEAMTFF